MKNQNHLIAANEGNAIALSTGYYLATEKIPLVYMQNSGIGNAVNPLLSLCDKDVYSIPMLILIGWRGEPGVKDEPQHKKQGKIQIKFLESMEIPYEIISSDNSKCKDQVKRAIHTTRNESMPYVLLVRKGTFSKYEKNSKRKFNKGVKREEVLEKILEQVDKNTIIVSTTGKTSREIFEIREKKGDGHDKDFLTVGSMGHCSSIALGIAMSLPKRNILCIDGDGSMIMHLGALTSIKSTFPPNFKHILINNKVHESVGGQSTAARYVNLSNVVEAIGYRNVFKLANSSEIRSKIKNFLESKGPSFFEIEVVPGSRENLMRPTITPAINKKNFMKFLQKDD